MRLFHSRANPFARKVCASAVALGLVQRIEMIPVDVNAPPPELVAANPLGKVPTLVTEDGFTLFDSPVICEFLNGISDAIPIIPLSGAQRWITLRAQALGDGIMSAAMMRRHMLVVGEIAADNSLAGRQAEAVARALDLLERETPHRHLDLGTIAIACALGYLEFRFPEEAWRPGRPRLAGWFESISTHECLRQTEPEE